MTILDLINNRIPIRKKEKNSNIQTNAVFLLTKKITKKINCLLASVNFKDHQCVCMCVCKSCLRKIAPA